MSRIVSLLKRVAIWGRTTITIFAAVTLLLTTSCSATSADAVDSPLSPKAAGTDRENPGSDQFTNTYDKVQSYEGGMNRYEDTDPRRDLSGVEAKSDRLIRNAEKNMSDVQDVDDFVENYKSGAPLGERIKNVGENVGEALENTADDADAVVPNKRERELAAENAKGILNNTAKPAKRAAQDAKDSAQRASREAAENTKRVAEDTAAAAEGLQKATQRTAKDAADAVSDTAANAAKGIKRSAEDAVDATTR